jgi:uncharacterized protein (TIGR03437 family)
MEFIAYSVAARTPRGVAATMYYNLFAGFGSAGLPLVGAGGPHRGDLDPVEQVFGQFPIFQKAIVTGGSFGDIETISPNMLIAVFSPYSLTDGLTVAGPDANTGIWQEEVGGVRAFFDGRPAPIIFTSKNQMSLLSPNTFAGPQTQLRIEVDGLPSNTLTFDVGSSAPQILTQNASGKGLAAVLNQDYTLNGPGNPAEDGEAVQIFYIPGVALDPPCPDGALTPVVEPLPRTPLPTMVRIGGIDGTTLYSGGAPNALCGAGQANAIVHLAPGASEGVSEQSLEIEYNGLTSQAGVTVAVRK